MLFLYIFIITAIAATSLDNWVRSYVFGAYTAVPLAQPNDSTCTSGASCPVAAGQAVTVNVNVSIQTEAQCGIPFDIEYSAVDGAGVVTCGRASFIVD